MRVLIIGLGSIASKHIEAIRSIRLDAEILALRSGKTSNIVEGVQNIYSLNELKDKPDFVIVSNPTAEHYRTLKEIVPLKCPVFIEKPALDDVAKAEELRILFDKNATLSYVAFSLRFLPCLNFIKENLPQKETINEVNSYCGSYLPDWRPGVDFRKNYSANKEMGGGVHLDLIHEIDYLYWIFGMPDDVKAHLRSRSSLKISSTDYAHYLLDYSNFTASVILNYYRRDAKRSLEIVMENDTWTVDLIANSVTSDRKGLLFQSTFNRSENYKLQMAYFLNDVITKRHSMNTLEDSLSVLKIVLHEST